MNIWITSDSHYGHKNISSKEVSTWKSGYRNFKSLSQMNETLIKNINDCVKEGDILYHLGDFAFGNKNSVIEFRNSLICKNIHLIYGNHDEHIIKDKELQDLFSSTQDVFQGYLGKTKFYMSHYSHRVWPGSHRSTIHLYGHSHGSISDFGKSMDVGIDCHKEFRPYHLQEIITIMNKREISKVDHHE